MSKRSIRRAAERAARKLQPKSQSITQTAPPPTAPAQPAKKFLTATAIMRETPMGPPEYYIELPDLPNDLEPNVAQLPYDHRGAINRQNARYSTGPRSVAGRQTSSLNAVKHGLTGHTVLLDTDDAAAYQHAVDETVAEFLPVTFEERRLAQSIHDCAWRLGRILNLESAYYAKGRIRYAEYFLEEPEDQRKTFIEIETELFYAREFRNLRTQEARLNRQREKDIKALAIRRKERLAAEAEAKNNPPRSPSSPSPHQHQQPNHHHRQVRQPKTRHRQPKMASFLKNTNSSSTATPPTSSHRRNPTRKTRKGTKTNNNHYITRT